MCAAGFAALYYQYDGVYNIGNKDKLQYRVHGKLQFADSAVSAQEP